jgi:hypothetical protein
MKNLLLILIIGFLFQPTNEINNLNSNKLPTYQEALTFKFNSKTEYEVYNERETAYYRSFNYKKTRGTQIELKIVYDTLNIRDFGGRQQNVKLDKGYLIGFDNGEFGGSLYWFDNDGIENYKISNGNIKDIIKIDNRILVTEGLAHLNRDKGQILELQLNDGKWVTKKFMDLKNVPYSSQLNSKNELIILTSKQLLKVSTDKKITELISEGFWSSLYPNSSIIMNDIIYFGMRNGILKMDLNTQKAEWLTE